VTLRASVLGLGIVLVAAAVLPLFAGWPALVPVACTGAVLVLVIVFEQPAYKPDEKAKPGPPWQQTDERFIDPETGKQVTVYVKPETGERRYVQTGEGRGLGS
jgi:hypothetical protein